MCNHFPFAAFIKNPLNKGQRCVILADGFYEWKTQDKGKQPFFIYFPQTLEKREDQDQPKTSASNEENLEPVCRAKNPSPDLTEVCFLHAFCLIFYSSIKIINVCIHLKRK